MLQSEPAVRQHDNQNSVEMQIAKENSNAKERRYLYLAGINVGHSVGAPMHQHVATKLGKPWVFINQECPSIKDVVRLFRAPTFAGGVVTMPYKKSIMPYLDELDDLVIKIGACNNVYLTARGRLRGSNTDWSGIKGSLLGASSMGVGKPALIIGAGGASRAALYALYAELDCNPIYIINRDAQEVADVLTGVEGFASGADVIHVTSVEMVDTLAPPFYIVSAVPDAEPRTVEELKVGAILDRFLENGKYQPGVVLDMCYKPRNTRILRRARSRCWKTVDGTGIIRHQIKEQWTLWVGVDAVKRIPIDEAWLVLDNAANASMALNM